MQYQGSCHCGKFVPRSQFQLLPSAADVGTYTFNRHTIKHHFCRTCGIHPYAEASDPQGNPMVAVIEGATDRPGELPLRQGDQFYCG